MLMFECCCRVTVFNFLFGYVRQKPDAFKVYFYEATNIGLTGAVEQTEISPHYWIFPLSQLADSHYD